MEKNTDIYCGPCEFKHLAIPAIAWCPICNEGMCKDCKEQHMAFAATRKHEIISIENYKKMPSFALDLKQSCDEHDAKLDFYCYSHNKPCCVKCVSSQHKECPAVCPIDEVVKHAKSSSALSDTVEGISDLLKNIDGALRVKKNNLKTVDEQKLKIAKDIRQFRKDIDSLLDNLESRMLADLDTICQKESSLVQNVIHELEEKKTKVAQLETQCKIIAAYGSDLQAFLATQELSRTFEHEEKAFITHLDDNLRNVNITLEISRDLVTLKSTLKAFGTIKISLVEHYFKPIHRKIKQAQYMPPAASKHVPAIKLQLQRNVKFELSKNKGINIRDCTVVSNGIVVFSDIDNKCLLIFDSTGLHIRNIELPYSPSNITRTEGTTVAVSSRKERKIHIFDILSPKLKDKKVLNQDIVSNISCSDGKLLTAVKKKGLLLINLENEEVRTVLFVDENCKTVHINGPNIYYLDSKDNILYRCNLKGEQVWKYTIPVKELRPFGTIQELFLLTTDVTLNLYVSCYYSYKLLQISNNGQACKVFLSKPDGVSAPTGIDYDKQNQRLLFCADHNKEAHIYSILD